MFAWPGSSQLDEKDISELVNHGTIGNGAFGMHARNVFLSDAPEFEFLGEETLGARRAYHYDFHVTQPRSSYMLRVRPYEARVGFHGSFWADADTLDLSGTETFDILGISEGGLKPKAVLAVRATDADGNKIEMLETDVFITVENFSPKDVEVILTLATEVEDHFRICLDEDDEAAIVIVEDLVDVVERKLAEGPDPED